MTKPSLTSDLLLNILDLIYEINFLYSSGKVSIYNSVSGKLLLRYYTH
jgi:hypothetical protein